MTIQFKAKHRDGSLVDGPLHPFTFPAGERHIKVDEGVDFDDYKYFVIDVRGADANDLVSAQMASQVLRKDGYSKIVLVLPYLPAARADRGTPNFEPYLELVAGVFPDQIIYLDPHSPAWVGTFRGNNYSTANLTEFPVSRIIGREVQSAQEGLTTYAGVIAPDKGAHDRAAQAAKVMGVPVYQAEKTRDFETGKLAGFHMVDALPEVGKFLLVDDICDGGGTFIGLADAIGIGKNRLDLWVTHGIFSKGLRELEPHFGSIHTTNSMTSREKLFDQHIHDHDIYELTNAPADGGFVYIHDIDPYLYNAVSLED